jgi:hypothetical protein
LVTAFGANLNSGLYRSAYVPNKGLHLHFSLNGMISIFSDDQKTFFANTEGYFYPAGQTQTATVVGASEGAKINGSGGTVYQFPGGFQLKSFATAAPTVTLGTVMGTEASVRYFSSQINSDIGKLTLFGLGARHSLSQYMPLNPVDLAVGFFYHNFKVGDIIKAKSVIAHAEIGKSVLIFDFYGGLGLESSSADINYTLNLFDETNEISINIKGENKFRALIGIGINLLVLHVNVDYNMGHQNLINAGLSIGL